MKMSIFEPYFKSDPGILDDVMLACYQRSHCRWTFYNLSQVCEIEGIAFFHLLWQQEILHLRFYLNNHYFCQYFSFVLFLMFFFFPYGQLNIMGMHNIQVYFTIPLDLKVKKMQYIYTASGTVIYF